MKPRIQYLKNTAVDPGFNMTVSMGGASLAGQPEFMTWRVWCFGGPIRALCLLSALFLQPGVCHSRWNVPPLESWNGALFTQ